ncbi:hypothetical protein [Actinopolymorpha rutila]|uniref:Uncharacterized protein n=1 Tax=Actinopolymorpha rutila TaxID=446787 RepID=A0A852ZJT2_9ACTN|nr:hypothetical protein [Actinopolymorpha rutila]NYH92503.1 hypothetical protein [Actinopolymorpha rutila]
MKRVLSVLSLAALLLGLSAAPASATVKQDRDRRHQYRVTAYGDDICGNPGTFYYVLTGREHYTWDGPMPHHGNGSGVWRWTLVYEDPALGTRTGREVFNWTATYWPDGSWKTVQSTWRLRAGSLRFFQIDHQVYDRQGRLKQETFRNRVEGC